MNILSFSCFFLLFNFFIKTLSRCPPKCTSGCLTGTPDIYTCSACQNGFFVENNRCSPCPAQCETCTSRSACLTCRKTTTEQTQNPSSGICLQCALQCKTCTRSPKNCSSCYRTLIFLTTGSSNTCTPSSEIAARSKCSQSVMLTSQKIETTTPAETNTKYCTGCISGFFQWQGQCINCPIGAYNCLFSIGILFDSKVIDGSGIGVWANQSIPLQLRSIAGIWLKESWLQLAIIFRIASSTNSKIDQFVKSTNFVIADANNPGQFIFNKVARLTDEQRLEVFNNARNTPTNFNLSYVSKAIIDQVSNFATISTCLPGLYLVSEPMPKCTKCVFPARVNTADKSCSLCENGFLYSSGVCRPCHSSCLTCTTANSATACSSCALPARLLGSRCRKCGPECASCDSTATYCATCVRPFSRYRDPNTNRCYRCVQDTCLDCLSTNNASCLLCIQGNTLNLTICVRCQDNCVTCVVQGDRTVCQVCAPGRVLMNDTCLECQNNCLTCSQNDETVCFKCKDGFFVDDNRCAPCPVGCAQCNKDFCLEWRPGYVSNGQNILACQTQFCTACDSQQMCVECQSGYFLDTATKSCRKCGLFCIECSSSGCIKCSESSVLGIGGTAGKCIACNESCATCNPAADINQCLSCRPGLYLSGTTCFQCPKYCDFCISSTVCSRCQLGYISNQQGTCTRCANSCNGECSPFNITLCFGCSPGFQLISGKCVTCGIGCDECQNKQCTKCKKGFKLVVETNNNKLITRCKPTCIFPCQKCENTTCQQCAQGFNLANNTCIIHLQCLPANDATCKCPQKSTKRTISGAGNTTDTYLCVQCSNDCQLCSGIQVGGTFTTTCTACLPGFYLDGSNCASCPSSCRLCLGADQCQECKDGFVIVEGTSNCVPCQNCAICFDRPQKCLTCERGFELINDKCIGSFTMGFTLVFTEPFQNFMAEGKLGAAIASMATILSIPDERIIINESRSGSTYVVGSASADNSTQAASLITTLSQTITSDPNALGSSVLSTSTLSIHLYGSLYSPPSPPSDLSPSPQSQPSGLTPSPSSTTLSQPSGTNIALIVGLTAGLGGGLVIAIAVLIYLKKTRRICNNRITIQPIQISMDERMKGSNTSYDELTLRKD